MKNPVVLALGAALGAFLLIGLVSCGGTPAPVLSVPCPPVKTYDPGFQERAADELAALPDNSPLAVMIRDYQVMRDQSRACIGE